MIKLAEYLFQRLRELGVNSVFGVPGDFNLSLLDYVVPSGLHWVGNANELNAGYAADGYARIAGLSALITTFGVGELSAINAIAGAYAERAPVVHIVGTPERHLQQTRARIHHTFNDGEFGRFAEMARHVTAAQVDLKDAQMVADQIDWVLLECLRHSRPVYIQIPVDMVEAPLPSWRLKSKLSLPPPGLDGQVEQAALDFVLDRMKKASQPMILVDGETRAFGAVEVASKIVESTHWPTWVTVFGKGLVDETLPNVYGIYAGPFGDSASKSFYDSCDLILCIGPHWSTTNSYQHAALPNSSVTICITTTQIEGMGQVFRDLPAKHFLERLSQELGRIELPPAKLLDQIPHTLDAWSPSDPIKHSNLWQALSSAKIIKPYDILLGETGTASHGTRDVVLPHSVRYFSAVTWLSIGYMLPAALGAGLAQRELRPSEGGRPILFIGDGSIQMTIQALSEIIREKLAMVIFLINNNGYTIERCLHGYRQGYNDVAAWRYLSAPSFFGADEGSGGEYPVMTHTAKTMGELSEVVGLEDFRRGTGLTMVELIMDKEDAPKTLLPYLEQQKISHEMEDGAL